MKKKHSIHNSRNSLWRYIISFIIAFGLMTIALANPATAKQAKPESAAYDAKVIAITDGDTITVLTDTKEQIKIRIYGIDAPERRQAFGAKAKQFLSSLIFEGNVTIKPLGKDLYGRTIAKVYHADMDVGLTMIESGHAWWYQQYAKKDVDYKRAQERAKKQQLGLWADSNPIEPSKFRKHKGE